ncbi:sterile alpha motif domain-containing protein 13 isoform X1 [Athene cunicularia]|uniref:sterile alpha motif domain-containing protein 13 isoform X1 n=1 Tax=Athene cunicularia TaxID=194338 RepID=UPI000EF70CF4|nr:sterile alpha motif domain-containing protein 13 isoform X1 [Athene cunicularia]XP_026710171.1 sterile alpha motif domain-containing protein 13 isoform X1 [Athene cunicularia]XP_026710172.1 sterile alpha motif domain-containing protein 13 isoform X1 [Athene cunicularia]
MLTVDMENKENGSLDVKNSVENGRPPDPADWAVIDVVNYFRTAGFEEQANAFQEQVLDLLPLDHAKLETGSASIASLNSSRKGNFRSVIAMSKILTGVKIPTETIATNGKERIETGFNH